MDRLPFLEWMQTYTLVKFLKDAQAGFVVATLVIPQVRNKEPKGHDDSRREVGKVRRKTDRVSCFWRYTHIWQGMSYANIAGLPFVAGLYAYFSPLIIYAFFGSSRQIADCILLCNQELFSFTSDVCKFLCGRSEGDTKISIRSPRHFFRWS